MKLLITSVANCGSASREYVVLRASEDCDLSDYVISDSTYGSDGDESNRAPHRFKFPRLVLRAGSYVYLNTRVGEPVRPGAGTQVLFWGRTAAVWNDMRDKAFLLEVSSGDIQSFVVPRATL